MRTSHLALVHFKKYVLDFFYIQCHNFTGLAGNICWLGFKRWAWNRRNIICGKIVSTLIIFYFGMVRRYYGEVVQILVIETRVGVLITYVLNIIAFVALKVTNNLRKWRISWLKWLSFAIWQECIWSVIDVGALTLSQCCPLSDFGQSHQIILSS